ncbi:CPBP family intramembrane glutamic endopeptidase [Mucilaginibacter calamicampi]|uniref:CPBP family intramembrane glutamic endopeptidase n=1 Tax=Mucilaginibacter calamicampi TaxID=1302352 RepID=A0ABW2YVF1_9SPHI
MAGLIVELIISWVLLKFILHQNLLVLGFKINSKQLIAIIIGLFIPVVFLVIYLVGISLWVKSTYRLNPLYTFAAFKNASSYVLISVIYEELIFRGALLYILIKKIGTQKALLVSAISFGIYHWFTMGVLGQVVPMLFVFTITAIMGYIFALSFSISRTIFLPMAIHLGYNFTFMIVFSRSNMGEQLLIPMFKNDPVKTGVVFQTVTTVIHYIIFPFIVWLYLNYLKKRTASIQPT